ncbi:putative lysis accessory protein [Edwardsiella phage eiAU-183]|uniref:Putative lysis accessory protein n=4 Tax=Viruses TaxID=10239 RepID=E7EKS7_9CAUD|nr:Rz-like spanin [Edwardsiella phage eiAU-183]YP_009613888.1 Rz-like spanin [Edwardsiella phage eiAU]ADV36487.1 putative lysis accessory protein [Edwardsiella phage eiDWF]ADV36536.1 putative lysis accessory protein [Edwardsiella phage eiMSLS]ADV36432.1 putative lysis accessory protein [Edwardsiella phage eiAU]AHG23454.1 putative lysis accessory protein [Edwardsiella phage eiAU]AHG23508.1 putative lysis accessory protein [Edwardsiella phage eiAU-183]
MNKTIIALLSGLALAGGLTATGYWLYQRGDTNGYERYRAEQNQRDLQALAKRKAEDDRRHAAKAEDEARALAERNQAVADADAARRTADGLRAEIAAIRRTILQYSDSQPAGSSTGKTAVLLTDVLEKSVRRNEELAAFADRSWEAANLCELSYDKQQEMR